MQDQPKITTNILICSSVFFTQHVPSSSYLFRQKSTPYINAKICARGHRLLIKYIFDAKKLEFSQSQKLLEKKSAAYSTEGSVIN